MKKIPTLFERVYKNHQIIETLPKVTKGMEWVLQGEGVATVKYDGSCCAIINGKLYKRYNAKNGKAVPQGAIRCQDEADPITGNLPCWVEVDMKKPEDKWFREAYNQTKENERIAITCGNGETNKYNRKIYVFPNLHDGTYEAIGVHFQGNPYKLKTDYLVKHGEHTINVDRTFEGIKKYLQENYIEGLVFWKDGKPQCKIKRSDFGLEWNGK